MDASMSVIKYYTKAPLALRPEGKEILRDIGSARRL